MNTSINLNSIERAAIMRGDKLLRLWRLRNNARAAGLLKDKYERHTRHPDEYRRDRG